VLVSFTRALRAPCAPCALERGFVVVFHIFDGFSPLIFLRARDGYERQTMLDAAPRAARPDAADRRELMVRRHAANRYCSATRRLRHIPPPMSVISTSPFIIDEPMLLSDAVRWIFYDADAVTSRYEYVSP